MIVNISDHGDSTFVESVRNFMAIVGRKLGSHPGQDKPMSVILLDDQDKPVLIYANEAGAKQHWGEQGPTDSIIQL